MAAEVKLICPVCSTSWEEIKLTKTVGCPTCYYFFGEKLHEILVQIHGTSYYNGDALNIKEVTELVEMKRLLANAIASENYEQAALYRDKIKKVEKLGKNHE